MNRPRLRCTAEVVETSDGDIHLLCPTGDSDLVIERPEPLVRELLSSLDGRTSRAELGRRFGTTRVTDAITALSEHRLVEDASDDDSLDRRQRARLHRQLRYFSDLAAPGQPAADYQRRLNEARVAVLGVGGLGSWAAWSLACCGVGELLLIDGDVVEPSNFNRQILYRESDIGRPKTDAAAETLAAFDSAMTISTLPRRLESETDVAEAIRGHDIVVDAADWPAHDIERWVNAACFRLGIPYIAMSHFAPIARIGPLYIPGVTGCYVCQEDAYRLDHPLYDEIIKQRRGQPPEASTFGPACAMVGGWVALDVVHHLTGLCAPASLGVAHILDLRDYAVTREPVPRHGSCPVCGDAAEPTSPVAG